MPSTVLVGIDEVGNGALAGPLVVCAAAAPKTWKGPPGLTDSKETTAAQRNLLYKELSLLPFVLVSGSHEKIDLHGVQNVLRAALTEAARQLLTLYPRADVIVDGDIFPDGVWQARAIPKADKLFPIVSAASILAKVNRDALMARYDKQFPGYGFATHVGYGVGAHLERLEQLGPCPIHRRSYGPVRRFLERT